MMCLTDARQRLPRLRVAVDLGGELVAAAAARPRPRRRCCGDEHGAHLGMPRQPLAAPARFQLRRTASGPARGFRGRLGQRAARVGDDEAAPALAPRDDVQRRRASATAWLSPISAIVALRPGRRRRRTRRRCTRPRASTILQGALAALARLRPASARPCSVSFGLLHGWRGSRAAAPKHCGLGGEQLRRGALGRRGPRRARTTSPPTGDDQHHARSPPRRHANVQRAAARRKKLPARTGSSTSSFDSHAARIVSARITRPRRGVARSADDERREDQQRPVPQVDRVGDVAEELDRAQLEHRASAPSGASARPPRSRPARRAPAAAPRSPGTASSRVEGQRRDDDRGEAGPGQRRAQRAGERSIARQQREQAAGAELPGPRRGDEVRGRGVGGRVADRVRQAERRSARRSATDDRGRRRATRALCGSTRDREQHQHRPDEVELLLGRQRPEVLDRRRAVVGGEVVDRGVGELPVLDVRRARAHLLEELLPVAAAGRRRSSPPRRPTASRAPPAGSAARAAPRSADSDSVPVRSISRSSSEVIRKPEIAKNTSTPTKPPGSDRRPQVVDDDEQHRDGAQGLDLGAYGRGRLGLLRVAAARRWRDGRLRGYRAASARRWRCGGVVTGWSGSAHVPSKRPSRGSAIRSRMSTGPA